MDVQGDGVLEETDSDGGLLRPGLKFHIGGGALHHAQQGMADLGGYCALGAHDMQLEIREVGGRGFAEHLGQRTGISGRRSQVMDQPPGFHEVLPEQFAGLADFILRGRGRPIPVGRFEQQQAAGQALGHRVMDFPGDPCPFGDDPGAALAGR
ncbi:hypothetical protein D3C74_250750 [compost metagenome]